MNEWDFIIVGAGSAGCVVANRLSADGRNTILLLEAGGRDDGATFSIPLLGPARCVGNPKWDWRYETEPDPSIEGRTLNWPRGKVLGGSSSINGTIYVRGARNDYDAWAASGLAGWGYDDLLPVFKSIEDDCDGAGVYGVGGEMPISRTRGAHPLAHAFVEAMAELGAPANPHYNGETQLGGAIADTTQRNGVRFSSARAFLKPAAKRRNLKVLTGAEVTRIDFDGKRAVGVTYAANGAVAEARCRREIIVSAGAIATPKLLMLSGVGAGARLRQHGVSVVAEAPEVGENLQEHANIQIGAHVSVPTMTAKPSLGQGLALLAQYMFRRGGQLSYILPAIAFAKTRPGLEYPDVQFHFGAFGSRLTDGRAALLERPAIVIQCNVNRTRSRGWIELRSGDAAAAPRIHPNLLADETDLRGLVAGAKMARAALRTKALAAVVQGEYAPGDAVATDADWASFVRANAGVEYHPCGTCRMGADARAVVDSKLNVRGVERLRVADASIIPQIPSANINAITLVIGEKASQFALERN